MSLGTVSCPGPLSTRRSTALPPPPCHDVPPLSGPQHWAKPTQTRISKTTRHSNAFLLVHCSANILRLEVWRTQVDRKSKSKAKLRKCFYSCYWRAQWPWSIVSLTYKIMKETICGQDLAQWEHTASAHSASVASPISGCLSCLSSSPLSSHIPQGTWPHHLHFHTTGAPFYDLPSVPHTLQVRSMGLRRFFLR